MPSKLSQNWIPLEKVQAVAQLEPAIFILLLGTTAWILYKLFLTQVSPIRHRNLRTLFRNLAFHSVGGMALFIAFWGLQEILPQPVSVSRIVPYLGLFTIIWGAIVFVKTCRILAFEYLFFFNMQVGVPLLLVNILSLLISVLLAAWFLTSIFEFRLAPLLATSTAFSIVLGLALQDTLGNLFAGIALQLDKPFEIGDWIEVHIDSQKVVGQVNEITWRAIVLIGFTEEVITIPNRVLAQSEVSNWAAKRGPVIRSQVFRVAYGTDMPKVRKALAEAINEIKGVRKHPEPLILFNESTENFLLVKLVYYLDDFGAQYLIADKVISSVLEQFQKAKLELASPRIEVSKSA